MLPEASVEFEVIIMTSTVDLAAWQLKIELMLCIWRT